MSVLNAQLEKLLANAERIKTDEFTMVIDDYRDLFVSHSLRLRPSVNSISLVSCSILAPQLGFSSITSGSALRSKLAALKEGTLSLKAPARPTPEKSVQSWLISQAMQNAGRIKSVEDALGDGHSYWYVSDEIALNGLDETNHEKKRERIVADMLLMRKSSKGDCEIVNVELKSNRSTETHSQILKFWQFMGPDQFNLWREFAETMLDTGPDRWKDVNGSRGIVIWPGALSQSRPNERTAKLVSQYRSKGIETICYSGAEYVFQTEPSCERPGP
ncbi:hypothetical protein [Bradyrhizobium guangxiense]|uniref:hypothetical protein n=1 Tax=Bradyrhizobium guangxiense TaxID=1325115 RepID=UPI0013E8B777|nr:hypothetical protein [Bradyrhizobium guangxiense]